MRLISTLTKGIYMLRNRKIVDASDQMLVYWNGERKGGTWNTIRYYTQVPINFYINLY